MALATVLCHAATTVTASGIIRAVMLSRAAVNVRLTHAKPTARSVAMMAFAAAATMANAPLGLSMCVSTASADVLGTLSAKAVKPPTPERL